MFRYKLIIFDFDGTLVDTREVIKESFQKTFQKFGTDPPNEKKITATIGLSLPESLKILKAPIYSNSELGKWIEVYRDLYQKKIDQTKLFPHVKAVLTYLEDNGVKLVVISNKGKNAITSTLKLLDIENYIDLVIGENKIKKPDPNLFHSIIHPKFENLSTDQFLMVGDTITDLTFAKNAQLDSCWVSYGYGDKKLCLNANPTHIINSMADLKNIPDEKQ